MTNLNATGSDTAVVLYMTTDNGNGTYTLSQRLTLAASYRVKLYVAGNLAAGGASLNFTVAPAAAYAPLCTLNNVESTGSARTGGTAKFTVRADAVAG